MVCSYAAQISLSLALYKHFSACSKATRGYLVFESRPIPAVNQGKSSYQSPR
jgi:hypothetical protein